jgi:hypothetical protein
MKKRTILILASAMLAGSLLATDAQARGGGGGHMGGGFGGGHMGDGLGGHVGEMHHDGGDRYGYGGSYYGDDGLYGDDGIYDDDGLYDDGLGCSGDDYLHLHHRWSPSCS